MTSDRPLLVSVRLFFQQALLCVIASMHGMTAFAEGGNELPDAADLNQSEHNSSLLWQFNAGWEQRYITEGRDNLAGHSVLSLSAETDYLSWAFLPALIVNEAADYTELDLGVAHAFELTDMVSLAIYYSYDYTEQDNIRQHDHEIGIDVEYELLPSVELSGSTYYSMQTDGGYLQLGVSSEHHLDEAIVFDIALYAGANAGYVEDAHRGVDSVRLQAILSYSISSHSMLSVAMNANHSINKDIVNYPADNSLQNINWIGVGYEYRSF